MTGLLRTRLKRGAVALLLASGLLHAERAAAEPIFAITLANNLLSFDSATPGVVTLIGNVGPTTGTSIVGIDFRPATGQLFGLGLNSALYTINTSNAAATLVGPLTNMTGGAPVLLSGTSFGVDFNPVPDRLRVVSNADQNLRINPDNGVTIVDGPINPSVRNITGSAYTNSFAGATSTTLYSIDSESNALYIQMPPNDGTQVLVGSGLGVNPDDRIGFDISGFSGAAFASFNGVPGATGSFLYSLNLTSGAASSIGLIGAPGVSLSDPITGIAIAPIPEPGTMFLVGSGALVLLRRRLQRKRS